LAYFTSAATWNYLTEPFVFTSPGVTATEIEPWDENGATWRRLAVRFPPAIANHNPDQVLTGVSCCDEWTTRDVTGKHQAADVTMSSTQVGSDGATEMFEAGTVAMKFEVVVVPVSDVDRARRLYEALGWRMDIDYVAGGGFRVVQLTPPGLEASIIIGAGITSAMPGSVEGSAAHRGRHRGGARRDRRPRRRRGGVPRRG
jgi:hypothetical protein